MIHYTPFLLLRLLLKVTLLSKRSHIKMRYDKNSRHLNFNKCINTANSKDNCKLLYQLLTHTIWPILPL